MTNNTYFAQYQQWIAQQMDALYSMKEMKTWAKQRLQVLTPQIELLKAQWAKLDKKGGPYYGAQGGDRIGIYQTLRILVPAQRYLKALVQSPTENSNYVVKLVEHMARHVSMGWNPKTKRSVSGFSTSIFARNAAIELLNSWSLSTPPEWMEEYRKKHYSLETYVYSLMARDNQRFLLELGNKTLPLVKGHLNDVELARFKVVFGISG